MSERRQTLLLIVLPLLATFVALRLYLHLIDHNVDLRIAGHEVHGILMANTQSNFISGNWIGRASNSTLRFRKLASFLKT